MSRESGRTEITEIEQQATKEKHPVTEGVQARESHVARSDHQRYEIVAESSDDGHAHEKDHRRSVHGEETVEHIGLEERVARDNQLEANSNGHRPGDDEETKGRTHVHQA